MDFYEVIVSQDNFNDWLDAHKTGIGASQIAAVLGENRFGSRLRVWAEKVGRLEPLDFSDNEAVQMGIELEPIVAKKYGQRTGRNLEKAGELLRSTLYPWAICTPDYWLMNDNGVWNVPCQIKTTGSYRLNEWAEGPPREVWWQVQHEMLVTGSSWASVGVLVGGQRFMWADVERDEKAIRRIITEGTEFWRQVKENEYPDPDANSSDTIVDLFPTAAEGETLALPQVALEWDKQLADLKVQRALIDDDIKELEGNIKLCIGEAEKGILHDGSAAYTHKNQERVTLRPMPDAKKPTKDGEIVKAIVSISKFRVLRRSEKSEGR